MWSWVRLTRRQLTSRPDHLRPELWIKLGRNAELKESNAKPKLDNARRLRGISFIDLRTRNSKKPFKMLEKLETPMAPAMPCKTSRKSEHGVTRGKTMSSNHNLLVFWKPVNPQDCVWENLFRIIMRTTVQERVTNHCNVIIWHTNLFLCLEP